MRTSNRCRYLWITSVIILPYVFGHSQCKRTRYIHHTANPSVYSVFPSTMCISWIRYWINTPKKDRTTQKNYGCKSYPLAAVILFI